MGEVGAKKFGAGSGGRWRRRLGALTEEREGHQYWFRKLMLLPDVYLYTRLRERNTLMHLIEVR